MQLEFRHRPPLRTPTRGSARRPAGAPDQWPCSKDRPRPLRTARGRAAGGRADGARRLARAGLLHDGHGSAHPPDWRDPVALEYEAMETEVVIDALGRVVDEHLADGTRRTSAYHPGGGLARLALTSPDGELVDETVVDVTDTNAIAAWLSHHDDDRVDRRPSALMRTLRGMRMGGDDFGHRSCHARPALAFPH